MVSSKAVYFIFLYFCSVFLIIIDAPRNLTNAVNNDIVTLQWTRPIVSNAIVSNSIQFTYEIELQTNNSLQQSSIIYYTTDNFINLNRFNITNTSIKCEEYTWSVAAIVQERISNRTNGDNSFKLQTGTN